MGYASTTQIVFPIKCRTLLWNCLSLDIKKLMWKIRNSVKVLANKLSLIQKFLLTGVSIVIWYCCILFMEVIINSNKYYNDIIDDIIDYVGGFTSIVLIVFIPIFIFLLFPKDE